MSSSSVLTEPTLWGSLQSATQHALACGALHLPEPQVREEIIWDHGIPFRVQMLPHLAQRIPKNPTVSQSMPFNPFLPYEKALFVQEISNTHVCLLNKFSVTTYHALLVTHSFVEQESALSLDDFEAIHLALADLDGVIVYNSGSASGGSQKHRHIHFIPRASLMPDWKVPIELVINQKQSSHDIEFFPSCSFLYASSTLREGSQHPVIESARLTWARYKNLLLATGIRQAEYGTAPQGSTVLDPYNMIMTRDWMLVIPRKQSHFDDIPVNGFSFAGLVALSTEAQLQKVQNAGLMNVLTTLSQQQSVFGCD